MTGEHELSPEPKAFEAQVKASTEALSTPAKFDVFNRPCTEDDCTHRGYIMHNGRCTIHHLLWNARLMDADDFAGFQAAVADLTPFSAEQIQRRRITTRLASLRYQAEARWRDERDALDAGATQQEIDEAIDEGIAQAAHKAAGFDPRRLCKSPSATGELALRDSDYCRHHAGQTPKTT